MTDIHSPLAVITGSAGAIGGATAKLLIDSGWQVIGLDVCRSEFPSVFSEEIVGDVADPEIWRLVRESILASGGQLQGLVHAAAFQVCESLLNTEHEVWNRVMDVNLGGFYLGCRALFSELAAAKGSVVAVGSVHSRATSANIAAYAASKGGLSALVRAVAIEWASAGIRVNAVLPGAVDSTMLREGLKRGHLQKVEEDALLEELAKRTVNGRIGRPEEIASVIEFFLDERKSSFATGSELCVDGGATIRLSTE